jgi:hypothetical protein
MRVYLADERVGEARAGHDQAVLAGGTGGREIFDGFRVVPDGRPGAGQGFVIAACLAVLVRQHGAGVSLEGAKQCRVVPGHARAHGLARVLVQGQSFLIALDRVLHHGQGRICPADLDVHERRFQPAHRTRGPRFGQLRYGQQGFLLGMVGLGEPPEHLA